MRKETTMDKAEFIYVTYISATSEKIWHALLDAEMTTKYWQHENVSDWKPGSKWEHRRTSPDRTVDLVGTVIESKPPRRLVISWADPDDADRADRHSQVTIEVASYHDVTCLTVTHDRLEPGSDMEEGITDGWPK